MKPQINRLSELVWEIPTSVDPNMRVPARIYADEQLFSAMREDATLTQSINMTQLPGILKYGITLPDGHQGYGFPIGGVAAFDADEGIITPGGVGYDINCGVLLMRSNLTYAEVQPKVDELIDRIFSLVPCGVGVGSKVRLSNMELDKAVTGGVEWAIAKGYGWDGDHLHMEENGCMKEANPDMVSSRAKSRGASQLGTLGAGNHFLEVAKVSEVYDKDAAKIFGITNPDQIVCWIHTGSRGYGHQIATDYIRVMEQATSKYKIRLPDRELACAPIKSREAEDYYGAMACAVNWAFINRHIILHQVRTAFEQTFHKEASEMGMDLVYSMGASRAFGPGREDLPADYKSVGQPVLLVGTMGTASYLLKGTEKGEEISFASTAHGAGRVLSRAGARRQWTANEIVSDLKKKGIVIRAASGKVVEEESPESYKDIHKVAEVSHRLGIGRKVMMSVPVAVAKG
jgi:tRNA-splicing ligase RtcB